MRLTHADHDSMVLWKAFRERRQRPCGPRHVVWLSGRRRFDSMAIDQLTESSSPSRVAISRRQFLTGAAAVGAGLTILRRGDIAHAAALPAPETSGIEHIVLVMMENRSFDHFFGWVPNADGQQKRLFFQDANGTSFKTRALAPDFQGCGHPDPNH